MELNQSSLHSLTSDLQRNCCSTMCMWHCAVLAPDWLSSAKRTEMQCQENVYTSYPKVTAMTVMSKPKKASSFLRPAEEETKSADWLAPQRDVKQARTPRPTVFVQEEEEEGVEDGDEDTGPQGDPAVNAHTQK